jgi:hypothetical protein
MLPSGWAEVHFGPITDRLIPRLVVFGLTLFVIGVQTFFRICFGRISYTVDSDTYPTIGVGGSGRIGGQD